MAKSNYERLLEKQIKQEKDAQRKREREAREDAVRQRAAAVVGGQPVIGGMRMMDDAAEELLRIILSQYNNDDNRCVRGDVDLFPSSYRFSLSVEFEKLRMYGVLSSHGLWLSGTWEATLAPQGITYFTDKEQAQKRHEEEQKMQSIGNITNYGNMVFGSVTGSTLSVDNSIYQIERMIDEKGGEDAAELHDLLEEVKELIDNMQTSRAVPKQKRLFQKINDHVVRHGWFYGAVVQLLGTAAFTMIGG